MPSWKSPTVEIPPSSSTYVPTLKTWLAGVDPSDIETETAVYNAKYGPGGHPEADTFYKDPWTGGWYAAGFGPTPTQQDVDSALLRAKGLSTTPTTPTIPQTTSPTTPRIGSASGLPGSSMADTLIGSIPAGSPYRDQWAEAVRATMAGTPNAGNDIVGKAYSVPGYKEFAEAMEQKAGTALSTPSIPIPTTTTPATSANPQTAVLPTSNPLVKIPSLSTVGSTNANKSMDLSDFFVNWQDYLKSVKSPTTMPSPSAPGNLNWNF